MNSKLVNLTYEVELQAGEKLSLPDNLIETVGAGHWVITIQPLTVRRDVEVTRTHEAFLNGYAPEDEGLYVPKQCVVISTNLNTAEFRSQESGVRSQESGVRSQ